MKTQNAALSRQLLIALLTPVVLLVAVAGVLAVQISRMTDDARWVEHSDEVLARTSEVHRQIIDQETGIRGYLLTSDRRFLEPYERAHPLETIAELQALVADNPATSEHVAEVRSRYEAWRNQADVVARGESVESARDPVSMLARKASMDSVRESIGRLETTETALKRERMAKSEASTRLTAWSALGLLIALALAFVILTRRQITAITSSYAAALEREQTSRVALEREAWIRTGHLKIVECFQGDARIEDSALRALDTLVDYVGAAVGALYAPKRDALHRLAAVALAGDAPPRIPYGEGVVGHAAATRRDAHLKGVPAAYLNVGSATGTHASADVLVLPAQADGRLEAVLELGFLAGLDDVRRELLDRVSEAIALAVRSARIKEELRDLLEETQRQSEELQTQQEELRVANEELQQQTTALMQSKQELAAQQEELESTNASLEEQTNALQQVQRTLVEKAAALERASQYKSEFLANMSHELRTPLNSSLILAKLLADNAKGNLDDEQVRYADTIHAAGNDLLTLINDILDLAKIEAGHMDVRPTAVPLDRIVDAMARTFEPIALEKNLPFETTRRDGAPESIDTDPQRLQQILKNLLSNAFKFTERGKVTLDIAPAGDGGVAFRVTDTGTGIPAAQQDVIFEAFRQADGTTNRKFGGTGLGLSISRELARLLGGQLAVESSEPGRGSTFRLTLPRAIAASTPRAPEPVATPAPTLPRSLRTPRPPSRATAGAGATQASADGNAAQRRSLLVVEDDLAFAQVLVTLGRELDYHCYLASTAEDGLMLARRHLPTAVVLDVGLPDGSGLAVLDRLKRDPATRHIPVHVVSAIDYAEQAMSMGAVGYMLKPVRREQLVDALTTIQQRINRNIRRLLIVEDDPTMQQSIAALLSGDGIECVVVGTVKGALDQLGSATFDCVVTDLALEDGTGYDLLETMAQDEAYAFPPVIVYTGRDLSPDDEQRLRRYSKSVIVKGARSPERLLDEVSLFLHQVESTLPPERRRLLEQARDRERTFEGRTVLVVEDDVRNVFALTSVLEPRGATVLIARNGREALAKLDERPDVDAVLMDVMMPEMDGLEATRAVRRQARFAKLPIIALTAKAMPDDRAECLRAGANDYIAKPLDVDTVVSLLRVWMRR